MRLAGRLGAVVFALGLFAAAMVVAGCGGSPSAPSPPPSGGGGVVTPPANNPPTIVSIVVQGSRAKEPANFADAGEGITVTANVKDDETPVAQLQFNWSASSGTFSGSGPVVTWQAPAQVPQPTIVTLNLEVVERYGTAPNTLENKVTGSAPVSLHDSAREVGEMARQFLLDFSETSIRDVDYIMRNFSASSCPVPSNVTDEISDVKDNRAKFRIVSSRIGSPAVTVNFGGSCPFRGKRGDACAVVPSFWESVELATNQRGAVDGNDIVSSAYSPSASRWYLCASDYDGHKAFGATLHGFLQMK
jgi:hypothetical protein